MKYSIVFLVLSAVALSTAKAAEVGIINGSATMAFDLPTLLGQSPLNSLDAAFGITETRDQLLNLPGNNPSSSLNWNLNPVGTPSPTGRQIQGTTLTIDPGNVLGTWGAGSDIGAFLTGGEQIGFGGMTRWTLDPGIPGVLLFGDWGLRYSPTRTGTFAGGTTNVRSGLVLTSNIDFLNATFADIGNANISVTGNSLSITGDLLVSDAMIALGFPSSNLGLDAGDFNLTATLVPEPTSLALLGLGGLLVARRRRSTSRTRRTLAPVGLAAAALLAVSTAGATASVLPNTTTNGVGYMTYDRAAWATLAPSADYYDIHGNPTGASGPTADVDGQRWMFPDRFEGTGWVAAAYPSDYLTALPDFPLAQPVGGFAMPVNTYGINSFAANHKITDYNSTTNPNGWIGLGGSLRATSDFNEPGASVWWEHLAVREDPGDSIWKIYATSGPGQGSLFELRNVTTETVAGNLHLSGDYVFGNTDWLQFFQDANGHLDTDAVLGHIEIVPTPEPSVATLLLASSCIAVLRRQRVK